MIRFATTRAVGLVLPRPSSSIAASKVVAKTVSSSGPNEWSGRNVLLAEFDVEQRTCVRWQAQRQARRLEPAIDVAKFSKEARLDLVRRKYDDIVMDTRGRHDELSLELATSSDVIFLPSSFSLVDIPRH